MARKSKKKEKAFTVWRCRIVERYGSGSMSYLVLAPTVGKAERIAKARGKTRDLMKHPTLDLAERLGDLVN